jgi:hypothetical protein
MKHYLLTVNYDAGSTKPGPEEMAEIERDVIAYHEEVLASGAWVFGGGLHPASTATVVRAQGDGDVLVTDGPFAESREQLGGLTIIAAPDLDAALAIAAKAAKATRCAIEVRPFEGAQEG